MRLFLLRSWRGSISESLLRKKRVRRDTFLIVHSAHHFLQLKGFGRKRHLWALLGLTVAASFQLTRPSIIECVLQF